MKNAFDANVPKRKPRTRLRGILDGIDEDAPEAAPVVESRGPTQARKSAPVPADPPPPETSDPIAERTVSFEPPEDGVRMSAVEAVREVPRVVPPPALVSEAAAFEPAPSEFTEPDRAAAGTAAVEPVATDPEPAVTPLPLREGRVSSSVEPRAAGVGSACEPEVDRSAAGSAVRPSEPSTPPEVPVPRASEPRPVSEAHADRLEPSPPAPVDGRTGEPASQRYEVLTAPAVRELSPLELIREPLARALGNISTGGRSSAASSDGLRADAAASSATANPSTSTTPTSTVAGRPRAAAPGADVVLAGRARIAELRARLQTSAKRREVQSSAEPAVTAVRIRETMSALRGEVRDMAEERTRLIDALELTRRELAEAEKALEAERRIREASETLAEERQEVAESLLSESEALAEERDEALARIVELRELDSQQAELVEDMQRQLLEHEEALQGATREVAEVRSALDAAEEELCAVQARLDARNSENERLRIRITELESEMQSTVSARDALLEIQKLVDTLG